MLRWSLESFWARRAFLQSDKTEDKISKKGAKIINLKPWLRLIDPTLVKSDYNCAAILLLGKFFF